jgi:hypothetical protein
MSDAPTSDGGFHVCEACRANIDPDAPDTVRAVERITEWKLTGKTKQVDGPGVFSTPVTIRPRADGIGVPTRDSARGAVGIRLSALYAGPTLLAMQRTRLTARSNSSSPT